MIVKLALLFVCVTLASGNPAAGKPWLWKSPKPFMTPTGPVKSSRIVGGQEATPHSYPHLAALIIDDMYFCSGSLISTEWVLTAAHCLDGAGYVEVVLGAHNIGENEATQVTITSTDFTVHEKYNIITLSNDIAVIRLPQPVTLNDYINIVGLPSYDLQVGTTVTLTGWGKPSDSSTGISPVLLEVEVPVIDNSVCNAVYPFITDGSFCTDSTGGQGICSGDDGGPAHQNGTIHGIVSAGASGGCEADYPDVITRVRYYLDWIEANTGVIP